MAGYAGRSNPTGEKQAKEGGRHNSHSESEADSDPCSFTAAAAVQAAVSFGFRSGREKPGTLTHEPSARVHTTQDGLRVMSIWGRELELPADVAAFVRICIYI